MRRSIALHALHPCFAYHDPLDPRVVHLMSTSMADMAWVPYSEREEWNDVEPIEQDDGAADVVRIRYSKECERYSKECHFFSYRCISKCV